ncbi:unnamed protein product [Triticum turgidum subsp. durum]|uniref:Uncharacterized protein n=1 Tax=Triticum turgidum subsp. durum TaxID=4567 RepID=A0A9R0ZGD0_TRITD|nr:unnamed protein product [Triticum turgidum subsp. durum]
MRVCIHPWFTDCALSQEVAGAEQTVKDGSPHKVNWGGIIWGIIEKEIHELPERGDGVCQYGAYLQRLIRVQKPLLFELPQKEEAGKLVQMVSSDLVKDERDGDADARNKGLQEVEPRDADADASSKGLKESELEGVSLTSNSLDESGPADADASGNDLKELESGDVRRNILEESETAGVDLRSNDLNESGDVTKILEESETAAVDFRSNDLNESGNARSNILEEPETEGSDLRNNDLKKSDSGDAGSKSMDELADVDANAMSKSQDTSVVADGDAKGMGLDVEMESGDVDANAGSKSLDTSRVADGDVKGMSLEQSKAGDAMVLEEAVAPTHETNAVNGEVLADFAWEEDEDTIVGAAEKDACPSPEVELLTQEKVLVGPEEDEEAEEEEKDEAGWSSANDDDDSMDVEDNVSVQNLDTDNEEAEESEHDAFEGCSGGVEMNWGIGDDKGGEGTTHCLQQCDFPGVEFENLNKGNVGMRDGVSFDDGFKMGSLHGMESNLLQAMNSDPATYNGTENAHDLSSGNFLAMGADAHKNGVDLGTGNSFFFGNNNGKRHVEDIDDGYNDQMQTQQQFLQGNQHKRMRNSSSSVPPGSAFFNANYSEPIQNLLVNASMLYEQKEREIQEALSQKQFMANLLQEKEAIIHSLNSARFEQENKLQAKLRCFEHDLNVMGQLVSGYKRALKQSYASFNEYRKKFPSNEFHYRDVPNGGGLVLSVRELERELERKRCEEEQQKIAAANEMIGNFKLEWLSKPDDWEDRINLLWRKTEGLARELDLLKEKRKAKLAALAREE